MLKSSLLTSVLFAVILVGCTDDSAPEVTTPETYNFMRNGMSTVFFPGQTIRIWMAEELASDLTNTDKSEADLLKMFRNTDENGDDVNPFETIELNQSTKSIKSKVAASKDLFFTNTTESAIIKNQFEEWIGSHVNEVFTNKEVLASPGVAGQLADGTSVRYVSGKGLEYNQAIEKGLIGALMVDQILNNYLSPAVLDEMENKVHNDIEKVEEGQPYTTMEHKWDEAYGYLFGNSTNPADPLSSIGADDSFLNKYVGRVEADPDFTGIANDIFDAFKKGRAAIVAKNYEVRDRQADLIKEKISKVLAIRAVYYLQQGKNAMPQDGNLTAYGPAFHDFSEGVGFVYSLRFTRKSGSGESYFSRVEIDEYLDKLLNSGVNGFWNLSPETLDAMSKEIADKFDFTVAQAAD